MESLHRGILALLYSAVMGEKRSLPQAFDLEAAYPLITRNGITTLVYEGALRCGVDRKSPVMQKLFRDYCILLRRSELQMRKVRQVEAAFQAAGIDYMLLKGMKMKALYPKPELRYMGDADILIRLEQYDRIKPIMEQMDFRETSESYHELVWKADGLILELHKCLFAPTQKDLYNYFGTGWEKAALVEGAYTLDAEEEYAYLFSHMAKHYRGYGADLRQLMDIFIYQRAHPDLDMERVHRILKELMLDQFHSNLLKTFEQWKEDRWDDPVCQLIIGHMFREETLEQTQLLTNAVREHAGLKGEFRKNEMLRSVVFPPLEKMRYEFRILFKRPWLLPFLWPVRWWRTLVVRPDVSKKKIKALKNVTSQEVAKRKEEMRAVGLEYRF